MIGLNPCLRQLIVRWSANGRLKNGLIKRFQCMLTKLVRDRYVIDWNATDLYAVKRQSHGDIRPRSLVKGNWNANLQKWVQHWPPQGAIVAFHQTILRVLQKLANLPVKIHRKIAVYECAWIWHSTILKQPRRTLI